MITGFLMTHFSYTVLFIWSVFEGEIGLTLAGMMSKNGSFDFFRVLFIAISGALIGDISLFLLGRFASKKVELWLEQYAERLSKIKHWFKHNAAWLIIFERFVYGTHIPALLFIGMSRYSFVKFLFFELLGVSLWAFTFISMGYIFANNIIDIVLVVQRHVSLFLLFVLLFVILLVQKKGYNKNSEN